MAKVRLTGATFSAASKTVTHANFSDVGLAGILLITNVTDQIIIYNFADTSLGGTLATDTLTLEYDTTSMSDTDDLMIFVDDAVTTLAVTQSGTWDEVGINDSGNSITVDNSTLSVVGGGTEATALRVTVASDSTGVLSVDDNGGSLTVDNAGLTALNGAISGTEVQVDVLTMPTVTVTATNLDVQSGGADLATTTQAGAIQTAVELIDDAIYVDDTATHSTGSSKGVGIMAAATPTDSAVNANDIGMVAMTTDRKLHVSVQDSIPAGTNNIGDVDILTIAAGDNNIGNVDIVTMPNVTNGGTFVVQENGSALTALQLLDDVIFTDDTSTHTAATTKVGGIGLVAAPTDTALNANDIGMPGMSVGREAWSIIRDAAGNLRGANVNASNQLSVSVDNTVTVTATNLDVQSGGADLATSSQGSGIQTAVELIDDTVKVLGTDTYTEATSKGLVMGAVRRDADTTLANTTNEFAPLQVDANGYLKVEVFDGGGTHTVDAPVGTPVNVQIGNATLSVGVIDETGASAVDALAVGGGTAHDAVDSGNPLKIGGKARQTNPTAVADADRADAMFDDLGRQVVVTNHVRDLVTASTTTISASTSETTVLSAGAAGVFHDLVAFWVANTSGTAARIDFRDATAGSVIFSVYVPAGDTRGCVFNTPFKQTTSANNWTAQSSASVTDLRIMVQACKNV